MARKKNPNTVHASDWDNVFSGYKGSTEKPRQATSYLTTEQMGNEPYEPVIKKINRTAQAIPPFQAPPLIRNTLPAQTVENISFRTPMLNINRMKEISKIAKQAQEEEDKYQAELEANRIKAQESKNAFQKGAEFLRDVLVPKPLQEFSREYAISSLPDVQQFGAKPGDPTIRQQQIDYWKARGIDARPSGAASFLGSAVPFMPGAGLGSVAGQTEGALMTQLGGATASKLGQFGESKILQRVGNLTPQGTVIASSLSSPIVQRAGSAAVKGAGVGAAENVGVGLAQGQDTLGDIAENAVLGGVFGGAIGGAVPLVGAGVKKVAEKSTSIFDNVRNRQAGRVTDNVVQSQVESPYSIEAVKQAEREVASGSEARALTSPISKTSKLTPEQTDEVITRADDYVNENPTSTTLTRPNVDDVTKVSGAIGTEVSEELPKSALKFSKRVSEDVTTHPELTKLLAEELPQGVRTSDVINRQNAQALIEKHGADGLTARLLEKKIPLSASEVTASQILARHFSNLGGKENLSKAVALISNTAKGGREMGQAIQALSQWNKLDQEGALLLAERQLNRRVRDTEDWRTLTPEQAEAIQQPAKGIEQVENVRNLAEEVTKMVSNKKIGEKLTPDEESLIKQFKEQVKQVDESVKPLLKADKAQRAQTIKEVGSIKPKERTRDQVVSFLNAKADNARERIARSRNRLSSTPLDIWADYAIIGTSHLASGAVKLSDWSKAMVDELGDQVKPYLNKLYAKSVSTFRKENGLPTNSELTAVINKTLKNRELDEETANSLRAMASEIGFYADDAKLELTQDLQLALKDIGTSTLGEKISTLQTSSMLLSVPTFMRNALGNIGFVSLEKLNKVAAVPIDWTLSKLTGERTVQFLPQNQENMFRNFMTGTQAGWKGVSTTGTLSSYDVNPNVFGNKNPLKYLQKTLGASLQGMDEAGYMQAYGDVLATYAEQLGKAQGLSKEAIKSTIPDLIKQLDQRVFDLADEAGLYQTFQDENILSKLSVAIKRGLNKPTDLLFRGLVEKGRLPESLSLEGFGAGDIVMKFAKTPANVIMRGIDYSPIGFMRGLYEMLPIVTGNIAKFNQFQATRALSRGITGTLGLTALGYTLASKGILTGPASEDPDKRSIEEQVGKGAYKANLSALKRWMLSGFDDEAAKFQKGDTLMDYSWIQPASISLGMGVNAALSNEKQPNASLIGKFGNVIYGGVRTVLENPMVQGVKNINDAVQKYMKEGDTEGFANIIKGVPASFIPAVVGQARRGMDNNMRETFDQGIWNQVMNLVSNKLPTQSEKLPTSYGSLGEARQYLQNADSNTLGTYLTALLSPAKFTKYEPSEPAGIVMQILGETLDDTTLPRIAKKSITYTNPITKKSEKYSFTPDEFSQFQKDLGTSTAKAIMENKSMLSSPNVSAEEKAKLMRKILNEVGDQARTNFKYKKGFPTR